MISNRKIVLALTLAALAIGCGDDGGMTIVDGGVDAGPALDAGEMDAGTMDAAVEDGGAPDAGPSVTCPSPAATPNGPTATYNLISISESTVVGIAPGDFVDTNDRVVLLNVSTDEATVVLEADGSFVLGQGAYDPSSQTVVIPDQSAAGGAGGLLRFFWNGSSLTQDVTAAAPSDLGPPVSVTRFGGAPFVSGCPGTASEIPPLDESTGLLVRSIGAQEDGTPDYSVTTISTVTGNGMTTLQPEWLTNGAATPGLTEAFSGDVVFPSVEMNGVVGLIDRSNGVITRICANGSVLGQLRASSEDFYINPYDYVFASDTQGYIVRFAQNDTPGTAALERGNDLARFDPATMMRGDSRVDMSAFNATVTGYNTGTMMAESSMVQTQPDTALFVDDRIVVGLSLIQFNDPRGHTDGAIAIIDPSDESVTTFAFEGKANCGEMVAVEGSDTDFIVSCRGFSDCGFLDNDGVLASAGIFHLRLGAEGVTTVARWDAAQ